VRSTLTIDADGRVSVRPGCNTGSGRATVDGGVVDFGPIALTKMACRGPAMDTERTVLSVLQGVVPYTVDGDALALGGGDVRLFYRAR
jgi:heat shock protein HslJ